MGLRVFRRWKDDDELLSLVRESFAYGPGDNRATLYALADGAWVPPLSDVGPVLLVELFDLLGVRFTVVAIQAYRDGSAMTGWHADTAFDAQAILSLGATRTFGLTDHARTKFKFMRLRSGDLIYMPPGFQDDWLHSIPAEQHGTGERCSLVFRTVKGASCTR